MKFLSAILFLLATMGAPAATYYIDYAAGSDTNSGTASGSPWKHFPHEAATGNAIRALVYGDVVNFKGGVNYILTQNGVPTNGVSYVSTWGTGKAVFTDNNSNPGHVAFFAPAALNDAVFRNLCFSNIGGIADYGTFPANAYDGIGVAENDGFGFIATGSVSNLVFDGCNFYKLGYWSNCVPMNAGSMNGVGILITSATGNHLSGILATNCHFEDMAKAISITAGQLETNVIIANCSFTGTFNWVVALNFRGVSAFADWIAVHDCTLYDFFGLTDWKGYGGGPHIDGIYYFGSYDSGSEGYTYGTNVFFYNDTFSASGNGRNGTIVALGTTSPLTIDRGVSANAYNNTFSNCAFSDGCISVGDGPNNTNGVGRVNLFYNTIINNTAGLLVGFNSSLSGWFSQYINFENNLLSTAVTYSKELRLNGTSTTNGDFSYIMGHWVLNYNCWSYPTNIANSAYISLNNWWNGSGFSDQDGNFHDIMRGVLHQEIQSIFTIDAGLNGLVPATNSPVVNAGADLSAFNWMPGFGTDKNGVSRGSSPTMGAFEINTNYVPPVVTNIIAGSFTGKIFRGN